MSTFQGLDGQKQRIEEAIDVGMSAFALAVWKDADYDTQDDPEEIREQVRSVVMALVEYGWLDFRKLS